jgi:hypothetical protein
MINKRAKERKFKGYEVVQILTDKATILRPYALKDRFLASRLCSYMLTQRSLGIMKSLPKIFDTSSISLGFVSLCSSLNSI